MKTATLLLSALTLVACTNATDETFVAQELVQESTTTATPEKLHNNITEAEIVDGWELMFDGQCLGNWRKYGDTAIGAAWIIDDEAIHLDASNKENWQVQDGGDIVYQDIDGSLREFTNFHFKAEWKIANQGNSGIIYFVHEDTATYPYPWMTGLEMQVLDNGTDSAEGHPDAAILKHRAGDLYDINEGPSTAVKLAGEWNQVEIIVQDGHLIQKLNGVITVERDLFDEQWAADVADSKFHEFPGYGTYSTGGFALQDHGDNVWFRNLRIKSLDAAQ